MFHYYIFGLMNLMDQSKYSGFHKFPTHHDKTQSCLAFDS